MIENNTNLPYPIFQITKTGEAITMEALSEIQYEKCYFPEYKIGEPLKNPRKTKVVTVKNVWDIFKECIKTKGYNYIPQ